MKMELSTKNNNGNKTNKKPINLEANALQPWGYEMPLNMLRNNILLY